MEDIKPLNLNDDAKETTSKTMIKGMSGQSSAPKKKMMSMILGLVGLGVVTGFFLTRMSMPSAPKKLPGVKDGEITKGSTFGVLDEDSFSDEAEGDMEDGGIDGEGSHHLVREGGETQYVYLTSSVMDLDQFVGKKVKVWGETFEAQQAGWLMDVGRLEVLE